MLLLWLLLVSDGIIDSPPVVVRSSHGQNDRFFVGCGGGSCGSCSLENGSFHTGIVVVVVIVVASEIGVFVIMPPCQPR